MPIKMDKIDAKILRRVTVEPHPTLDDLAKECLMTRPGMQKRVDRLVKAGYLTKVVQGRKRNKVLTEEGRAALNALDGESGVE